MKLQLRFNYFNTSSQLLTHNETHHPRSKKAAIHTILAEMPRFATNGLRLMECYADLSNSRNNKLVWSTYVSNLKELEALQDEFKNLK